MGLIEIAQLQSQLCPIHNFASGQLVGGFVETSVSKLKDWYQTLDAELEATVSALSDEDFEKMVERGFAVPLKTQLEIYLQALLIFFGKVTIYLKAMNKPLTQKMQEWVG